MIEVKKTLKVVVYTGTLTNLPPIFGPPFDAEHVRPAVPVVRRADGPVSPAAVVEGVAEVSAGGGRDGEAEANDPAAAGGGGDGGAVRGLGREHLHRQQIHAAAAAAAAAHVGGGGGGGGGGGH